MIKVEFRELIGKHIIGAILDGDSSIIFNTATANYVLEVTGGCCSKSWIENANGISALKDCDIYEVEGVQLDSVGIYPYWYKKKGLKKKCGDNREIKYYAFKLKTIKGHVDIEFRNDSNGYYGAQLHLYRIDK